MPTITGTAQDVGTSPLGTSLVARMHFRIDEAGRDTGGKLHFRKEVTEPTTSTGTFTVALPEYVTHPHPMPVWVGVSWLTPDGYGAGGYTSVDWLPYPIYVPRAGGDIGALIGKQVGNDLVYAAPNAVDTTEQTGFQLNTVTGDLYQWKA